MSKIVNKHGNFTLVPNGFVCESVSHEAFRLYVVLLMHAPGNATDGGEVFPDYERIKTITGIKHNKTVANALRALEASGWLERRRRFGASTIYTLTSPSPRDVIHAEPVRHAVTSITSPDDVHYVTPSKTNKTQVTKPKEQDTQKRGATRRHPSLLTEHSDPRVAAYIEIVRPEGITATNADAITKRISNPGTWREVCIHAATAGWRPTNFEALFDTYDRRVNAARVATKYPRGAGHQHFAAKQMTDEDYRASLAAIIKGDQ